MNEKVLIITLEYPPQVGGIASYVYNVALHLPAEKVVVYAPKYQDSELFDNKHAWKIYRNIPYWFFLWPRWIRMLFQIRKIVKTEHIDLIHVHQVLPVGYVTFFLKFFLKIPYVIFLHGTDLKLISTNRFKFRKFRVIAERASMIVVNSLFMKQRLQSLKGIWPEIRVLYPSPADFFITSQYSSEELQALRSRLALEGKKVMLTVARFVESKGYTYLVKLLPKLLQAIPELIWVVVGVGPQKAELVTLIQQNSLQSVVRILGKISYGELPKIYQLADIFVLLTHANTTTEEGWGTVFLEAAAMRLPVVAGRVGGVEEAVEQGVAGIVVDATDDQQVISSIVEILKNSNYARKLGEQGRERIEKEFNWNKQLIKLDI